MRSSGVLLKPSEKTAPKKNDPSKPQISTPANKKQTRFEHLKQIVRSGLQTAFEVGAALLEIRDNDLYKHEFPTFEAFCESEFKIVRSRAYQLIEAAQIKEALPPDLSKILDNDAQARALKPVPVDKRAEVVEKAAEKGEVTAKAITEAAREVVPPKPPPATTAPREEKPKHLDKTGYPIPESIIRDWQQAESFRATLNDLQRIKLQIEKAIDKRELIYREVGQDTVADLKNAWTALKQVLPYAVCPTCQGRTRDKCSVCKQRGFVSEFAYEHWFAKEVIELREKAIKK